MALHLMSFLVEGAEQDVRDLGDDIRATIERIGFGLEVELVRGPTILAGVAVDAAAEEQ